MQLSTVLMVDDNEIDIRILRHAAETECHFQVHSASTAEKAMAYLANHSEPDLVVLDCSVGMDEECNVLRRLLWETRLRSPIVLLSGYLRPQVKQTARAFGVPCFEKPMELEGWYALAAEFADLSRQSTTS